MVVNKTFSEDLVKHRNEYEGVRRVVRVNRVEATTEENYKRQPEAGRHGIGVFPKVRKQSMGGRRRGITIDRDAIDDFASRLPLCGWTDHRYPVTRGSQRKGFPTDSQILGERQVLEQHENSVFAGFFRDFHVLALVIPDHHSSKL